ncbi:hypothetical protein [Ideonella sp.]|uniref:hypothetical protein n=1 Tax=Ideonella sp. TaxID=1929293 RepID=UPI002B48C9B6|nr:hypothetical protein [Ideonella sp.]HJV69413.1 hypothetical protein [Ideonella sp.]
MNDDAKTLATECLQAANACHDDDPPRGAELLQRIDAAALDPGQQPLYGFLLNHVLTEKLGLAAEAWRRQQALLAAAGEGAALPVLRHAAAAARLAGEAAAEDRLTTRLASAAGVGPAQASELVGLAAASFTIPRLTGAAAGEAALAALAPMHGPAWRQANGLDAAAGALTSNLASDLVERPLPELAAEPLRRAMADAAELAQNLWHRAGRWVQHERAHYLRAMVANALGDVATAAAQARAGLVLLENFDQAGQERVDQAFLRSELAHALARAGEAAEAQVERSLADALAEAFDDAGLTRWYQDRLGRQAALSAAAAAAA